MEFGEHLQRVTCVEDAAGRRREGHGSHEIGVRNHGRHRRYRVGIHREAAHGDRIRPEVGDFHFVMHAAARTGETLRYRSPQVNPPRPRQVEPKQDPQAVPAHLARQGHLDRATGEHGAVRVHVLLVLRGV